MLAWLRAAALASPVPPKVLWIQIRAYKQQEPGKPDRLTSSVAGPITTLLGTRSTAQQSLCS